MLKNSSRLIIKNMKMNFSKKGFNNLLKMYNMNKNVKKINI